MILHLKKLLILFPLIFILNNCGDLTGWYGCSECLKNMPPVHNKGYTKKSTTGEYVDVPLTDCFEYKIASCPA